MYPRTLARTSWRTDVLDRRKEPLSPAPIEDILLILWNHSVGQHFTIIPEMDLYQSGEKACPAITDNPRRAPFSHSDDLGRSTQACTADQREWRGLTLTAGENPTFPDFCGYKITGGFCRREFRRIQGMERVQERIRGAFPSSSFLCVYSRFFDRHSTQRRTFKESPVSTEMLLWQ